MIRIKKRAVSLSPIPTPPSDAASILPHRSQKTSPLTVQLPAPEDTSAVNEHSLPLDLHVLGPHLHGRTTLESPLVQVHSMAEVKPSLIHGGEDESIVGAEMEKMMPSIFEDGKDQRKETKICEKGNNHQNLSLSSFGVDVKSDCKLQPQPQSSSIQVTEEKQPVVILTPPAGQWLDGDKNMPLKKRKASLEMIMSEVKGTKKMMMMSKINKKSSSLSDINNSITVQEEYGEESEDKLGREAAAEDDEEVKVLNTTSSNKSDSIGKKMKRSQLGCSSKKTTTNKSMGKKGREVMLVQGSRCSRVNGRGWRCSQPTLVGYSLCEHHLGKGRLIRSISCCTINPAHNDNIKRRSISPSSIIDPPPLASPKSVKKKRNGDYDGRTSHDAFNCDQEEDEHMVMISNEHTNSQSNKKRVKLGRMVKARSLSSLLGQLNTMV